MKIHARVHLYPPSHCAGAEMMLHALLRSLIERGHQCEVSLSRRSREDRPYDFEGVRVFPCNSGPWLDQASSSDILVTHLDNTAKAVSAAIALRKPLVQVLHNGHWPTRMWATCKAELIVANSEWLADHLGRPDNMIVVRPPVKAADYDVEATAHKITLINLNQAKGGVLFAQLAALRPMYKFLGIKGAYGEQIIPNLPNVEIVEHAALPMREVYAQTGLLLMPSEYESWGRTGIEAMSSGIPVIAHPTPGLQESLDIAGIFVDRADLNGWLAQLDWLGHDDESYAHLSALARQRAAELDPTEDLARWVEAVESLGDNRVSQRTA